MTFFESVFLAYFQGGRELERVCLAMLYAGHLAVHAGTSDPVRRGV